MGLQVHRTRLSWAGKVQTAVQNALPSSGDMQSRQHHCPSHCMLKGTCCMALQHAAESSSSRAAVKMITG